MGVEPQLVALTIQSNTVPGPDKASPELHAPTPVSGLEKVPVMTVWVAVLMFPFEPMLPSYACVVTVPPEAVLES